LKYSSGYWKEKETNFADSEREMLRLYSERAKLRDGQKMLELGCGWGSLSLYLAETYPNSQIVAVSNSTTQKQFIDEQARTKGFKNLKIITCDINTFEIDEKFDRILSVEMFEHMRNYERLFEKIGGFLKDDGLLFVHIFANKKYAYPYESDNPNNWMARYFFTGGMMPSEDLFCHFQKNISLKQRWRVNGKHYQKTCEAWLAKMDLNEEKVMPLFKETYSEPEALKWWVYWRVFFMACAELFGYSDGNEWFVAHYLFEKQLDDEGSTKKIEQVSEILG
jgi:cyclopropane-fatty-acyl-phospholipid synthase